ncbi:hypothetical protein Curi_c15120 [Gottschalkia acidurici 9a]|uniref:Uncharacterized protein n=1 Tax=Gottschalkia acidurici (strain ATCC 7906 / DSM 604 / BCRC 14475 / CIP 104303 / KCTC 5404 / NCIMB 10678 / 9a) TaxID=1128398 RepID=K0B1G5_GOTA9|nr:hypothetical protein [Gottschalkia acidurici]AFS78521.1 hypothetical protein Curi_c15120 [Gottschalkia acidurici 9a]
MTNKTQNVFKYISLVLLLSGIAVWVWYIVTIIILGRMPYGEILITVPIGMFGVMTGLVSKNNKLIVLNIIQALALPVLFYIASFQVAAELKNR